MKNWMTWTCVALALCFAVGMLYAAEGDKPKTGKGKMEGPRAMGKVKSIAEDGTSIVVTVKKEEAVNDMTFAINGDTKVFVGREAKTLQDVKVGANVIVPYKVTDAGNVAVLIRVVTGERKGGGEGHEGH